MIGMRFRERLLRDGRDRARRRAGVAGRAGRGRAWSSRPSDEEDEFWMFRSHVVREVAYDSILRRRRPRLHRAVAEALLALEPERAADNVELIASHYELSDEPGLRHPHLRAAVEFAEASHSVAGTADRARRALGIRAREPQCGVRRRRRVVPRAPRRRASDARRPRRARRSPRRGRAATRARATSSQEARARRARRLVRHDHRRSDGRGPSPRPSAGARRWRRARRLGSRRVCGPRSPCRERSPPASRAGSPWPSTRSTAPRRRRAASATRSPRRARSWCNGVLWLWEGKPVDARTSLRRALELVVGAPVLDPRRSVRPLARRGRRGGGELRRCARARGAAAGPCRRARRSVGRRRGASRAGRAVARAGRPRPGVHAGFERPSRWPRNARSPSTPRPTRTSRWRAPALDRGERRRRRRSVSCAALLERDPWLGWRLEARLELARARHGARRGRRRGALGSSPSRGGCDSTARARDRQRVAADAIEGEALALLGDPDGLELVEQALADAEQSASPYLVAETARALARVGALVGGERGALAQARADAALSGTVSAR